MNTHEAAGWIVYFNGIEVPAITASTNARVRDIPQCRVTFPPDVTMRRIGAEDRVRVTIFFYDADEQEYQLLFDGEIVDYGYTNTEQGRELYYVGVDMVAALTQIFPIFVTGLSSLMQNISQTMQNSVGVATNPQALTFALFNVGLNSGEFITRPYDFVHNVISLILGEGVAESTSTVIANHWFTRWLERTKFLNRIIPSYDAQGENAASGALGFPILEAAQSNSVVQTLAKQGDEIANSSSYYMLIQTIFQRVYYEMNPVLAPPCVAVDSETRFVQGDAESVTEDQELALGQHITQPKNFFGLPPKCNVVWPSMTNQHAYSENFAIQPTRTYLGSPHLVEALARGRNLAQLRDYVTTVGYPEQADIAIQNAKASSDGETNPNNFLVYPEEFFRGPVYNKQITPQWFSMVNDDTGDENMRLQRLYAAMEHHRERMSHRNGSVNMHFNPYAVVGHPCAVVDNLDSNQHVYGYVVSVSHQLGQESMTTQMSYTNGQTFEEFFENLVVQREEFADETYDDRGAASVVRNVGAIGNLPLVQRLGIEELDPIIFAPMHPIYELRNKFQRASAANDYYNNILWANGEGEVIFDWRKIVGVRRADTPEYKDVVVDKITLGLTDSNAVARESEGYIPFYDILPEYAACLEDPVAARRFIKRPVCSLEEYIDFNQAYGAREGLRAPENPREGKMAPYYVKILNFTQGPGEEPQETEDGGRCGVLTVDTRRNWEVRFLKFRQKVYHSNHPHKA